MITILFFADTHLGFDFPMRPRVEKNRRGMDFFNNYERILETARGERVDMVVHGGDFFFRSKVPGKVVDMAYERLAEFARHDIPVFIVPGNHERSMLPRSLFLACPHIHIFHTPSTCLLKIKGANMAVAGFPSFRGNIRDAFSSLSAMLYGEACGSEVRLLLMHEVVEGARVGPSGYTFRYGEQVIRKRDLPAGFHCILSGHIHRQQVLRCGTGTDVLPVIYPGSVERTSWAERDEKKGFYMLRFTRSGAAWTLSDMEFRELPARPMVDVTIPPGLPDEAAVHQMLRSRLSALDPSSIVRIKTDNPETAATLTAAALRSIAPATMNIEPARTAFEGRGHDRPIEKRLKQLPPGPGVYLFVNKGGGIIYVGKSTNLRSRVSSYFRGSAAQIRFRRNLKVDDIRVHSTATELLALLLEDRLIKKHLPELNQRQKEFLDYRYLMITGGEYPALKSVDSSGSLPSAPLFGPFRNHFFTDDLREILCTSFKFRHCVDDIPSRKCMKYEASLCSGPCFGAITPGEYHAITCRIISFLGGDGGELEAILAEKMTRASEALDFEVAARHREKIRFIEAFCRRQKFLARFSSRCLIVWEKGEHAGTYIFDRGSLVKVISGLLSPERAHETVNALDKPPAAGEDPRFVLDRGIIVYNYLQKDGLEHLFREEQTSAPGGAVLRIRLRAGK